MSTTFVQVGKHWINLDQVVTIELADSPHEPGKTIVARVHFATGKSQDFTAPSDVQALADWLRNHKTP